MTDDHDQAGSAQERREGGADERERRIQAMSDEIVRLYERIGAIRDAKAKALGDVDLSKGPSEYERMRQLAAGFDRDISALGQEVTRTMADMRVVQAENPAFNATLPTDPNARLDAEILELGRRLNEVADAQAAAVSDWNANPVPELRAAFEAELARLYAQFDTLSRNKALLLTKRYG